MVEALVRKQPVMGETLALVVLCLADIFLTLVVVLSGRAIEANPLLASALAIGPLMFVAVKLAWTVPGIIAVELVRWSRPTFARWTMRFGVAGYLAIYVIGTLVIH